MDSCDEGGDDDDDDDDDDENDDNDDDDEENVEEEEEEGLDIVDTRVNNSTKGNLATAEASEEGPCKVRTTGMMKLLRTDSVYNGVNQMGQAVGDVVKSLTNSSSRCSGSGTTEHCSSANEKNSGGTSSCQARDQLNNIPSTESTDTATTGGGQYYSWDEQSVTFSKFMKHARVDVTKHFPLDLDFIHANDTNSTVASSAQPGEAGFMPSLDDDDDNDDDNYYDDDDYSLSATSSEAEVKDRFLIKSLSNQPKLLGAAKEIGEGLLLRTRSNLGGTGASSLPKSSKNTGTMARSRSFGSSDLVKVATKLNRQKLRSSNNTKSRSQYGSTLCEIAEEKESQYYDSDDDTEDAHRSKIEKRAHIFPTTVMLPVSHVSPEKKSIYNDDKIERTSRVGKFSMMTAIQSRLSRKTKTTMLDKNTGACTLEETNPRNQNGAVSLLAILKSSRKINGPEKRFEQPQSITSEVKDCEIKGDDDNSECIVFGDDDEECEVIISGWPEDSSSFHCPPLDETLISAEQDCVEISTMETQVGSQEEYGDEVKEEVALEKKIIFQNDTKQKSAMKNEANHPKRQRVVAGVTFEVELPTVMGGSDEDRLQQQQRSECALNITSAQNSKCGPDNSEELVSVSTKVFIDMFDTTKPEARATKEAPTVKCRSWRSKLQQRRPSFFGRKTGHKGEKISCKNKTTKDTLRKALTVEDRLCSTDLHLGYTTTEESTDSHTSYDISNSKSSLSFAFSESMKKVSMLQVVNAINEELRVMNERSLAATTSKNTSF